MTRDTPPRHRLRDSVVEDAPELARLWRQLGHPITSDSVAATWRSWTSGDDGAIVAVREDGTLAGAVAIHRMRVLHRPAPVGRITALIVDAPDRGRGLGRELVAAAESALARSGCELLELTSNDRRVDAHDFYRHLGYSRTSIRLAKDLTGDTPVTPIRP